MRQFCSSSCQAPKKLETSHFYLFQYLSKQPGTMCFLLFQPCYMQSKTISGSQCYYCSQCSCICCCYCNHHHHVFYL
uniref:Uncharacterized protein n=1 Tax=Brassica campestris TaxID=3711 RepID=A0A3P6AGD9_BRACM|nr:unnamed protein product [Brassica rapa]